MRTPSKDMPWRADLARNWKLSNTGHPPSRIIWLDSNSVFFAALSQNSKWICFDGLVGRRSKFAIIAFERERSRHDSATRLIALAHSYLSSKIRDISSLVDCYNY